MFTIARRERRRLGRGVTAGADVATDGGDALGVVGVIGVGDGVGVAATVDGVSTCPGGGSGPGVSGPGVSGPGVNGPGVIGPGVSVCASTTTPVDAQRNAKSDSSLARAREAQARRSRGRGTPNTAHLCLHGIVVAITECTSCYDPHDGSYAPPVPRFARRPFSRRRRRCARRRRHRSRCNRSGGECRVRADDRVGSASRPACDDATALTVRRDREWQGRKLR